MPAGRWLLRGVVQLAMGGRPLDAPAGSGVAARHVQAGLAAGAGSTGRGVRQWGLAGATGSNLLLRLPPSPARKPDVPKVALPHPRAIVCVLRGRFRRFGGGRGGNLNNHAERPRADLRHRPKGPSTKIWLIAPLSTTLKRGPAGRMRSSRSLATNVCVRQAMLPDPPTAGRAAAMPSARRLTRLPAATTICWGELRSLLLAIVEIRDCPHRPSDSQHHEQTQAAANAKEGLADVDTDRSIRVHVPDSSPPSGETQKQRSRKSTRASGRAGTML
jgi:hypothetical protein